jgi:hypothetical protein
MQSEGSSRREGELVVEIARPEPDSNSDNKQNCLNPVLDGISFKQTKAEPIRASAVPP